MRQWYGVACCGSGLGWSPKTFWRATLAEFFMAIEGQQEINRSGPAPMTRDQFEALEEQYLSG